MEEEGRELAVWLGGLIAEDGAGEWLRLEGGKRFSVHSDYELPSWRRSTAQAQPWAGMRPENECMTHGKRCYLLVFPCHRFDLDLGMPAQSGWEKPDSCDAELAQTQAFPFDQV